jgi:hypothetical protein
MVGTALWPSEVVAVLARPARSRAVRTRCSRGGVDSDRYSVERERRADRPRPTRSRARDASVGAGDRPGTRQTIVDGSQRASGDRRMVCAQAQAHLSGANASFAHPRSTPAAPGAQLGCARQAGPANPTRSAGVHPGFRHRLGFKHHPIRSLKRCSIRKHTGERTRGTHGPRVADRRRHQPKWLDQRNQETPR